MIEAMIVVALLGILAAVALPSFLDSVRKGRRSEAVAALAQVQQAQERWRANRSAYTTALTTAAPDGLGLASVSSGGLYDIRIDAASGSGYTATASAVSGKSQSHDSLCSTLRVRMAGGNVQYGGCGGCELTDSVLTDPNRCWSR
jgi:type IV pilus assembly protein PilE